MKKQTSILLTEENRQYLKENNYKNNESFTDCVNRLLDAERKAKKKQESK